MPTVAINPPKTPVTKGSNGMAAATLPNICKMPPPPPPFCPTPLPNIGMSGKNPQRYSTTVKIEGQPVAIQGSTFDSVGDLASKATGGGIVSNNAEGPTAFIAPGSLDVKIEGRSVHYLGDQMLNNCGPPGTPANSATLGGVLQDILFALADEDRTPCKDNGSHCWEVQEAKGKQRLDTKIADAKASRRRGTRFEAKAAQHNKDAGDLKRSSQLSGSAHAEKVFWKCSVCHADREGDQLHDGPTKGSPPIAVEVKSKRKLSGGDLKQLARNIRTVGQGGASGLVYKVPAGTAGNYIAGQLKSVSSALGCPIGVVRV